MPTRRRRHSAASVTVLVGCLGLDKANQRQGPQILPINPATEILVQGANPQRHLVLGGRRDPCSKAGLRNEPVIAGPAIQIQLAATPIELSRELLGVRRERLNRTVEHVDHPQGSPRHLTVEAQLLQPLK